MYRMSLRYLLQMSLTRDRFMLKEEGGDNGKLTQIVALAKANIDERFIWRKVFLALTS